MSRYKSVFQTIRRSPYQSFLAIVMTTITFFMISVFALIVLGATQLLNYFESRPQVTAFFKDEATSQDVDSLKSRLENSVKLESSKFISKTDALSIYQAQNKDNPLLLEMVTAEILPSSLEVSSSDVNDLEKIASIMQADPFVEEVIFQKDVIDTLKKWLGGIRLAGAILTGLLIFASVSTIIIIIGLKFRGKKPEVYTLSLLGATSWYIRSPYVAEAIFYSVIGSTIGWGVAYLSLLYLTPNLINFLGDVIFLPVPLWVMFTLLAGEVLLGIILGTVASLTATRRYAR